MNPSNPPRQDREDDFTRKRKAMVESQIYKRGIRDKRLLAAFETVPRHYFVSPQFLKDAYSDKPLPIGMHQTISQPYIVAYMIDCLELKGDERVLEIGTGSGYETAILAEMVAAVYTIEIIPQLSTRAERILNHLNYRNIFFKVGDGHAGWPEQAPFDAIVVSAAPSFIPAGLTDQLADRCKMIIPVGDRDQELIMIVKSGKCCKQFRKIPVRFVPMTGED
ncbi:MAG: protein-L-isoaspartate(D-aspartate) O-methyltransferase [Calditrichaeota bacterium]|nr:protein-L-isoaspartate(D-aspartate) O-methyltransferase [Calditrichota bacterium]MCB9087145.1 protein-L-isoaspartate(D-aspartate) O-methyltransferase [Calditrichia bacterium]